MSGSLIKSVAIDLEFAIMDAGSGSIIPCGDSSFTCRIDIEDFIQVYSIVAAGGERIIGVINGSLGSPAVSSDAEKVELARRVINAIKAKLNADDEVRRKASRAAAEKCGLL